MNNVTPKDSENLIKYGAIVIDVRTPDEFTGGHIPNAINIDIYDKEFTEKINTLDRNAKYIINCQSGGRSLKATSVMYELGFTDVKNLEGGITSWIKNGLPTEVR